MIRIASLAAPVVVLAAVLSATHANADVAVSLIDIGLPNTIAVKITGPFTGNEILRLKAVIADLPPTKRVVVLLDSPGGAVVQGEALGRFLYDARIPTVTLAGDKCASACTDVFLAGRDPHTGRPLRILASGGQLGFHNVALSTIKPEMKFTREELQELSRGIQQIVYGNIVHMMYVKAPLATIKLNAGTLAAQMNFISESDALKLGVSILNRETGKLVVPDNLDQRMRKAP